MNRVLVYILLLFFALSCVDIERPKKPKDLISKNKMIDVITDISLVNAAKGINKKLLEQKGVNPEKYIYQKYNIDSVQFAESNNYYAFNVKEYEDIYLKVTQRLEIQKEKYQLIIEKEQKEKDSIKSKKLPQGPKPINHSKRMSKSPQ